jgi:hypothetical protein
LMGERQPLTLTLSPEAAIVFGTLVARRRLSARAFL